jgi:pyridoxal 5'-phosphate synthase pdxT subunit
MMIMETLKKHNVNADQNIMLKNSVVGVLALQGAFREHIIALKKCGVMAREIKFPQQLDSVDGLIIPGGESTTIYKLIEKYNFRPALAKFYKQKKPLFGTCAGLILLAKEVTGNSFGLGYIDITVDRNAYGRQVDSFEQTVDLELAPSDASNNFIFKSGAKNAGRHDKFNAIFIRAPKIEKTGENVQILSSVNSVPVFARQENVLVCAFHPELTDDLRIHQYFIDMVIKSKNMIKLDSNI